MLPVPSAPPGHSEGARTGGSGLGRRAEAHMTQDSPEITSEAEFNAAITDLLRRAHRGNVEVSGAWECRSEAAASDYEVVITPLETQ